MNTIDFSALVSRHRNYFRTGATRSAEWRESQLAALRAMMTDRAEDFYASLWTDLRRNRTDADLIDVRNMSGEVEHVLSHLRDWMKPAPVSTPSMFAPSDAEVRFDPLGVGLIIGTWNYPVHLAEIYSSSRRASDAEALLISAISSGDPEVRWRLADLLASQKRRAEAEVHMQAARFGFEALLERHLFAFVDHGAEFYAGSGDNSRRALELARINVANRPTLRAFEQLTISH